jgi:hypothetical protein
MIGVDFQKASKSQISHPPPGGPVGLMNQKPYFGGQGRGWVKAAEKNRQ